MAGKKYKTLTEKWAAEDAAKAAAKRSSAPAKKSPAKKSSNPLDFFRNRKNTLDEKIKEAGASRGKAKSGRRYT